MKDKKITTPQFYEDKFVLGYVKHRWPYFWTYVGTDDEYLDRYYFPDIFGPREELEPILIALVKTHANLEDKKVRLTNFMCHTLSPDTMEKEVIKGKYIYPGEINDPNLTINIIRGDSQGGGKEQQ